MALAVVALCLLSLALLIWGPETSTGGTVLYTGCGLYEPVPGKPNVMRPMLDVCNQR